MAIQLIRHCERVDDLDYIAQKLHLPHSLVEQCKANVSQLQSLKNQKGKSRFLLDSSKGGRILPCIETAEEKQLLPYFCKQLEDYSKHDPKMIEALKRCIHKTNTTESGLIFNLNDIDLFKMFLAVFYPLFPAEYWACDLPKSLKYKDLEHMIYIHQIKSKKLIINKRNKSFRIYLKSQKNNKSLSLLKYVIIILSTLTPELFKQKNKIDFH